MQALEGAHEIEADDSLAEQVVHIKLNVVEFAEALGMQPNSLFVKNVFLLADDTKRGLVTFQSFLDLFAVFLKGDY